MFAVTWWLFGSLQPIWKFADIGRDEVLDLLPLEMQVPIGDGMIASASSETGELVFAIQHLQVQIESDTSALKTLDETEQRLSRGRELLRQKLDERPSGGTWRLGRREFSRDDLEQESTTLAGQLRQNDAERKLRREQIGIKRDHVATLQRALTARRERVAELQTEQTRLHHDLDRAKLVRQTNSVLQRNDALANAQQFQSRLKNQIGRRGILDSENPSDASLATTPATAELLHQNP